jgi:hypothetical protein
MKIKTRELTGPKLDWAVAKALNIEVEIFAGRYVVLKPEGQVYSCKVFTPSTNWAQGGPIIEREWLDVTPWPNESDEDLRWVCEHHDFKACKASGPTPLVTAMRCFCPAYLGEEVEIPENLILKT